LRRYSKDRDVEDDLMIRKERGKKDLPNLPNRKPLSLNKKRLEKVDQDLREGRLERERDRYAAMLGDFYGLPPSYVSPVYRTMMGLPSGDGVEVPDLEPFIEDDINVSNEYALSDDEEEEKGDINIYILKDDDLKEFDSEERLPGGVNPSKYWDNLVYNPRNSKKRNNYCLKKISVKQKGNWRFNMQRKIRLSSSRAEVSDLLRVVKKSGGRIRTSRAMRELQRLGYSNVVAKSIISDSLKVSDLSEQTGWLNYDDVKMENTPPYITPKDFEGPDPDALPYNAAQQYAHDLTYTRKSSRRPVVDNRRSAMRRRMAAGDMPPAMEMYYHGRGAGADPYAPKYTESNDADREDYGYMKYFDKSRDLMPPQRNVHEYGEDLQKGTISPLARREAARRRYLARKRRADYADSLSTAPKEVLVDDDYALRASDMPVPDSIQEIARDLAKRNGNRAARIRAAKERLDRRSRYSR